MEEMFEEYLKALAIIKKWFKKWILFFELFIFVFFRTLNN